MIPVDGSEPNAVDRLWQIVLWGAGLVLPIFVAAVSYLNVRINAMQSKGATDLQASEAGWREANAVIWQKLERMESGDREYRQRIEEKIGDLRTKVAELPSRDEMQGMLSRTFGARRPPHD